MLAALGTETERWLADGHALLRARFRQLEACPIAGAAHLLHLQRPAPVAQGVAAFFARHLLPSTGTRSRAAAAAAPAGAR